MSYSGHSGVFRWPDVFDLRESSGNVESVPPAPPSLSRLPRQRPGNENRFALVISDTLSIDADPFDRDDHEIAGPDVFGRFGPLRPQFRAAGSFRCRCLPFEWFSWSVAPDFAIFPLRSASYCLKCAARKAHFQNIRFRRLT